MSNLLLSSQAAVKRSHGVEVCQTTRHGSYPYCILCKEDLKKYINKILLDVEIKWHSILKSALPDY